MAEIARARYLSDDGDVMPQPEDAIMRFISTVILLLAAAAAAGAAVIRVPGDYATIQEAIDNASQGDTVLVADGVYSPASGETFPITMKSGIVLRSENGPALTTIDACGTQDVIWFQNVDSTASIEGFSITGGSCGYPHGGGITCNGSSPRIAFNWIHGNRCDHYGGGILVADSSPFIEDNWIGFNFAVGNGGGLEVRYASSPVIRHNFIIFNRVGQGDGGGIKIWTMVGQNYPVVENNTIAWTRTNDKGGGLYVFNPEGETTVRNNLFLHNKAYGADAVYVCRGPGGGIYTEESYTRIINNTICFNYAESHLTTDVASGVGSAYASQTTEPEIRNNIIASNLNGYGILSEQGAGPDIAFNDVWNNGLGDYFGCCAA